MVPEKKNERRILKREMDKCLISVSWETKTSEPPNSRIGFRTPEL